MLGAAIALRFRIGLRTIGLVMGFGSGVLISAVAFDLMEEAADTASGRGAALIGMFAGCGVFFGGDLLIDRAGGTRRRAQRRSRRTTPRSRSCSEPCSTESRSRS